MVGSYVPIGGTDRVPFDHKEAKGGVRCSGVSQPVTRLATRADCPAKRHGTAAAYKAKVGCRCTDAIADMARVRRRWEWSSHNGNLVSDWLRVPATAARRRAQGLAAEGWTWRALARLDPGVTDDAISDVALGRYATVTVRTDRMIARTCAIVGGRVGNDERQRRMARRKGWVPLAAWDDITNPKEKPKGVAGVEDAA